MALWEPDITPSDDWLISGILYQERISTFAPWPDVDDRDGQEANRLRALLGELYQPLSLGQALHPADHDVLLHELRARLSTWQVWAQRSSGRTADRHVQRWLERSNGWRQRRHRLEAESTRLRDEERQARRVVAVRTAALDDASELVESASRAVEIVRERLGPTLDRERDARRAARATLLDERQQLIANGGGWGANPETDVAVRRIDAALKDVTTLPLSPAHVKLAEARGRHADAEARRLAAKSALARAKSQLADVIARRARNLNVHRAPWESDVNLDPWLAPQHLRARIPLRLDTIAAGKVHGDIFRFLATEGGMWVSQDPRTRYTGTLVGPDRIIRDVLRIVALWHCNQNDGWVPMSGDANPVFRDYEPLSEDELVSIGVRALLPVPVDARIEDVVAFRLQHEDELAAVRLAIAGELPPLASIDQVTDFVNLMRVRLAEPLAEVDRALELDASLRRGHIVQTALHRAGRGTRAAIAGLAAAGIAIPVLGNTASLDGIAASVGGGIAITAGIMGAQLLWAGVDHWRQPRHGPYQYLYDIGREFRS